MLDALSSKVTTSIAEQQLLLGISLSYPHVAGDVSTYSYYIIMLLLIAINPKSCWLKLSHLPAMRSWLSDVTLQRYEVAWLGMWLAERWQSVGKALAKRFDTAGVQKTSSI